MANQGTTKKVTATGWQEHKCRSKTHLAQSTTSFVQASHNSNTTLSMTNTIDQRNSGQRSPERVVLEHNHRLARPVERLVAPTRRAEPVPEQLVGPVDHACDGVRLPRRDARLVGFEDGEECECRADCKRESDGCCWGVFRKRGRKEGEEGEGRRKGRRAY